MEKRVAPEPERGGRPENEAMLRLGGSDQECGPHEQKDQSDVADENAG
jgi:hypothetical protein